MNSRFPLLFLLLGILLVTPGCIDLSGLLDIRPDGSGTVTLKIYNPQKNPAVIKARKDRLKNASFLDKVVGGIKDETEQTIAQLYNPSEKKNLLQLATVFGPGVRLHSNQKIKRTDGTPGVLATYTFDDVNKLRIGPQELGPGAEPGPPPWAYRFKLVDADGQAAQQGAQQRLIIYPPPEEELRYSMSIKDSIVGVDQIPGFEGLVRRLMAHSRIKFVIKTGDRIIASNAIYAAPGRIDTMILADLEMKKLMQQLGYARMLEISNPMDLKEISGKHTPGILLENPDKVIAVDFR